MWLARISIWVTGLSKKGCGLYPILRIDRMATFEHPAQIYRTCRRRGLTVRKAIDCLTAALYIEGSVGLFPKDSDFDAIARVAPLRFYRRPDGE
jgi:predicted nucleic acid-binding protein